MTMRFLILADLHFTDADKWKAFLEIECWRFDAVLLLGDIDILLLQSIKENFKDKPMIGVLGNHDYPGDLAHFSIPDIHGKRAQMKGYRFLGVEGCVRYKAGEAPIHEQEAITDLLRSIPEVDIVLSHNSPKGIHDKLDAAHVGYEGLLDYMVEHMPAYVFHGHQHRNIRTRYKETEVIGVYGGIVFDTDGAEIEVVLEVD